MPSTPWYSDGLVGQATQATNQPTNDDGVPNPDKPYYEVTLAIDPDTDLIFVGDPCPGSQPIGVGMINSDGEWTRLDFHDGWHPVPLRQALGDEREEVDRLREQVAKMGDQITELETALRGIQSVALKAIDLGEAVGQDLDHTKQASRAMSLTLLRLIAGPEEEVADAFNRVASMFMLPPCDICDSRLIGESDEDFNAYREEMRQRIRAMLLEFLNIPNPDKDNHDQ